MTTTYTEDTTITNDPLNDSETTYTNSGDVLDTPALELPPATPEIHSGTVVSVGTKVGSESGSTFGVITLQSKQTGLTYELAFFPPQEFFDSDNWGEGGFDVSVLSDTPPPGKKQTPREAYGRAIASKNAAFNKDGSVITDPIPGKDGVCQLLRKLAAIDGFTVEPGTPKPTNGEEYLGIINSLVAGRLDVLFTRRPSKNDNPQFDGQLRVNSILPTTETQKANFGKRFSSYRIMWEEQ